MAVTHIDVVATVHGDLADAFPAAYDPSRLGAALVAGESWQGSPTLTFAGGGAVNCSDPPKNDSLTATPPSAQSPYSTAHLQLISDPTFIQVVQGRYPYCTVDAWSHHKLSSFSAKNKVWARQCVKFQANQYTTRGSAPSGFANSHKLMFLTWAGGVGNRYEIEFSNTSQYIQGGAQTGKTFTATQLVGSAGWGSVTTEWTGGEWWEYTMNYEIRPTDTSREPAAIGTAIARQWKRQLTVSGVLDPQAYEFSGSWWDFTVGTPAQVGTHSFWANRNKTTDLYPDGSARPVDGSDPFHVYYGPFEVVDGEVNDDPYSLQGTGE